MEIILLETKKKYQISELGDTIQILKENSTRGYYILSDVYGNKSQSSMSKGREVFINLKARIVDEKIGIDFTPTLFEIISNDIDKDSIKIQIT